MSLVSGLDQEASRTVSSSTPVRLSVPLPMPRATRPLEDLWTRLEDKRSEDATGRDSRRRSRIGHREGVRNRCGEGIGKGVRAHATPESAGSPDEQGVGRVGDLAAVTELAEHLIGEGIE